MEEKKGDVAMRKLQEAVDSDPNSPSHHFDLGHFLWKRGEEEDSNELKGRAVEHFVVSAKLNPNNGTAFRYLGHCYGSVSVDRQRASKCYQRAVTLNPDDSEAGEGLCDLLDGEGKESLEIAVCREASERSPRAFWAFRRLGYLLVHQRKWPEAVQSLQHAIRGYPACADLWEALGLAYQRLGMFTAALKSYGRAVELEDSKIFALVESGNILLMLGSFRKGIEQFRHALELSPYNISARFGLASGLLGLSQECTSSGAFVWGASLLEEASDVAKACADSIGNVSATWKLHGDIQIAYAGCFPWGNGDSSIEIDEKTLNSSINCWKSICLASAVDAKCSYQRALHLTPWQANIYTDVAISLDLVYSFEEQNMPDPNIWNLPEKMSLGGLMLEGENKDIWVVLGCLSNKISLKQHAFIRGLHLDASLSVAWAYLGKLYRKLGEKKLARQAFDHARSIDPSLALPWVGMSLDASTGECSREEAYESCLRAAQILPLADFQVGLGALATLSGHLLSPQVFGAIKQAVQRAPFYPESHNLDGLLCEARSDFQSAIAAYRRAKCILNVFPTSGLESNITDVSTNLARSLFQAGFAFEAVRECEELKKEGLLDSKGLQIYAAALWQLGKSDLAITEAKHLAAKVSTLDQTSRSSALGLICKLLYSIKGVGSAVATIVKFPKEFLQSSTISVIIYAISAIEQTCGLESLLPVNDICLRTHEEACELHYLSALREMLASAGSEQNLGIQRAIHYLRRALHMYPNSSSLRMQLSSFLLSSKCWMAPHTAIRCIVIPPKHCASNSSKSPYEITGSAAVGCYASCTKAHKFSFPTCRNQCGPGVQGLRQLQKWLHQEPWNHKAHYLLALNVLQKAREEKFPEHFCVALNRLVLTTLSNEISCEENQLNQYQKFQLLLCASEICLQRGDYLGCVNHATDASRLLISRSSLFFGHLQLCRAYAALEDLQNLTNEYMNCLRIKTEYEIGWISLKYLDYRFKLQDNISHLDLNGQFPLEKECFRHMWAAIFHLVLCQRCIWDLDFIHAEEALRHANSLGNGDRCLLLCHGAICMVLARQQAGSQFLSLGRSCLAKARNASRVAFPIVSALLAQAEASLGARAQWEKNLRCEWFSWPPEMRPAEVYFQMHLLARQPSLTDRQTDQTSIEFSQIPERWILRAIHLNPSCLRYWRILRKLTEY